MFTIVEVRKGIATCEDPWLVRPPPGDGGLAQRLKARIRTRSDRLPPMRIAPRWRRGGTGTVMMYEAIVRNMKRMVPCAGWCDREAAPPVFAAAPLSGAHRGPSRCRQAGLNGQSRGMVGRVAADDRPD